MNGSTAYPPPPWHLQGQGLMVFTFKDDNDVSAHVPDGLFPENWLPGKTPAGFYIAQYDTPLINHPTPWHEWGDVFTYARHKHHKGFWIREMAVDNKAALHGGIEQWGLNKCMASINFITNDHERLASLIHDDESIVLEWKPVLFPFPFQYTVNFLSQFNQQTCTYNVTLQGSFQLCRVNVNNFSCRFTSVPTGRYWGLQFQKAKISILNPFSIS
jgi:hypothetical protein